MGRQLPGPWIKSMKRGRALLLGALGLAVLIQFVPYGAAGTNPPVTGEPDWDQPRTRELFFRACKDCHSNETVWPWYAGVAPAAWLMRWDVDEARSHFNVSEWGRPKNHGDDAAGLVRDGEMPLWYYLPAHPEARLSEEATAELIAGLVRTFGDSEAPGEGNEEGKEEGEDEESGHHHGASSSHED